MISYYTWKPEMKLLSSYRTYLYVFEVVWGLVWMYSTSVPEDPVSTGK